MKCRYILLTTTGGEACRYGIAAVVEEDGVTVILESCIDLSPSQDEVERMVALCNALDLALDHFWDVVEDFVVIH